MSEVKSCPFRKSGTDISIDDYRKKNGCLGCDLESTECCADCIVPETWEADVAPVIHAHWIEKCSKVYCSACRKSNKAYRSPYCPHCGARMHEEAQP